MNRRNARGSATSKPYASVGLSQTPTFTFLVSFQFYLFLFYISTCKCDTFALIFSLYCGREVKIPHWRCESSVVVPTIAAETVE